MYRLVSNQIQHATPLKRETREGSCKARSRELRHQANSRNWLKANNDNK
jgi:hypothetical protein